MNPDGLVLSEIWLYPIKSLGGFRVPSSKALQKGLEFDRRYALVGPDNIALTQRTHSRMALFKTSITDGTLTVAFGNERVSFPARPSANNPAVKAKIWDDEVEVVEPDIEISRWFSEKLGTSCRLVFFPEQNVRPVDASYRIDDEHVSLADAYPILILGEESLADLNSRLAVPVNMDRFRPNFVFRGGTSFSEDSWSEFQIGSGMFRVVKACSRCVLTTVDQNTGAKGKEPLATLSSYRAKNGKVYFGQNVLVMREGVINEGEAIRVMTYHHNSVRP